LKRGKYCVLNKQYSEVEYNKLCSKIAAHMLETGEWGEYFPPSLSCFGYNETMANEHFPLSKEDALSMGWKWSDYQSPAPSVDVVPSSSLADTLPPDPQGLLDKAILCEKTSRPFRISKQELKLYQKLNLPPPSRHPDERYRRRMRSRNQQQLWKRSCAQSGESIWTSYAPESPDLVYSESAYREALK
jgi:hypothetical protein